MIARDRPPEGSPWPCPCPKIYRLTRVDRVLDYLNLVENRLSKFHFAIVPSSPANEVALAGMLPQYLIFILFIASNRTES
jgi:hypothetical protein